MRYGYCKNCFWCKWGYCFMQNKETRKESYCPDFYSRRSSNEKNEKLEQVINHWIAQKQMSVLELNNIKSRYKNSKQKGE